MKQPNEQPVELPGWAGRARRVEKPTLEVGFIVWDDLYYGPENDFSPGQWKTLREPLYQPAVASHPGNVKHVFTSALDGPALGELARHYADVLRLGEKYARAPGPPYFWLTPYLFSPGGFEIRFAYHDTRDEAERLFDALESPGDGEIYGDVDQGRELTIFASGDRLFVRHADFDTGQELACIWCDRETLVGQVAPLRSRLERILAELRAALGGDYWSRTSTAFDGS
ncbi:MAG TPA: hypothetical protein VFR37_02920 [Longimicrobium sp.]|nr:hypothetical protein [Longimicrobium sp.]